MVKVPYSKVRSLKHIGAEMGWREVEQFFERNKDRWNDRSATQELERAGFTPQDIRDYELKVHFGHGTALGWCIYRENTISIAVTGIQMLPANVLKEIVLHELAHALAGVGNGHNAYGKG